MKDRRLKSISSSSSIFTLMSHCGKTDKYRTDVLIKNGTSVTVSIEQSLSSELKPIQKVCLRTLWFSKKQTFKNKMEKRILFFFPFLRVCLKASILNCELFCGSSTAMVIVLFSITIQW